MDKRVPTEILFEIFGLLSHTEQIKCRLISKTIRNVIDKLRPKSLLVVHHERVGYQNGRWFFSNQLINQNDVVISRRCPPSLMWRTAFKNLKQLFISLNYEKQPDLIPMINQLTELEQLSICDAMITAGRQSVLCLPKLKMLSLHNINFVFSLDNSKLKIDAGQLFALRCDSLGNPFHSYYEIVHPNSVVYLELKVYDQYAKNFQNLEYLSFSYSRLEKISDFAKLKAINMFRDPLKLATDEVLVMANDFQLIEMQRSVAQTFYQQNDLKLFINGYRTAQPFAASHQSIQQLFEKSPMPFLTFVETVDYSEVEPLYAVAADPQTLLNNPKGNRPNEFIFKFPSIRTVKASRQITNIAAFFDFLSNCKCLNKLKLHGGLAEQAHFDRLPAVASTITRLAIDFQPDTANNLQFMLSFRHLVQFRMNVNIDLGFIQLVFTRLRFFRKFTYGDRELKAKVTVQRRCGCGGYSLSIDGQEKQFADLSNVWEYLHLFKAFGRRE